MGITISSKRHSCDMGYAGFGRLRNTVAEKLVQSFINITYRPWSHGFVRERKGLLF